MHQDTTPGGSEEHEDDDQPDRTDIADPATMRVRLMADRCTTCVFRPGNLMHLSPGRLAGMVAAATANQGHVTCHDSLNGNPGGLPGAMCRGWEQHPHAHRSLAVRWMKATGMVTLVDPATGHLTDADYRTLPPLED